MGYNYGVVIYTPKSTRGSPEMMYLVLPAYNEEKDLGPLLERVCAAMSVQQINYRVLLVNDGSQDGTVSLAQKMACSMPVEVLDHVVNKGLGQAVLTGLRRGNALAGDGDVVVTMDGITPTTRS